MRYIDLRSDTVTRPSTEMRKVMAQARVGDDVFEDDPTVQKLEQLVAGILGQEKGLFVPSGTMGNEVCIRVLTKPGEQVILEEGAHIYRNEAGAAAGISGIQLHPLKGEKGVLTTEQIEDEIPVEDVHHPNVTVIAIENTHTQAGGTIFPLSEIKKIKRLAKERKIQMHLDGARLWNACIATKTSPDEYAKYFDCLSVCLSKGLGAPIGSVVAGTKDFIYQARRVRKMYGGGMRQVGIIAAAGIYALKHNYKRLAEDHSNARLLAEKLLEIENIEIDMSTVQTNLVVFDIKNTGLSVPEAILKAKNRGVLLVPFGKTLLRAVTHLDVSTKDVLKAVDILKRVFSNKN